MSWLDTLLDFLNKNDGAITGLATVVLVGITAWYARMTKENVRLMKEYVHLTQEMLKATNKPEVIILLRWEGKLINIRVENIGTGYASDVKFTGPLLSYKARPQFPGEEYEEIKKLPPFKNGIRYLGSGQKIDTLPLFSMYVEEEEHIPEHPIGIEVSYSDSTGARYDKEFHLEPRNWEDTSQFISPQTDDIANELRKIGGTLEWMRDNPSGNNNLID